MKRLSPRKHLSFVGLVLELKCQHQEQTGVRHESQNKGREDFLESVLKYGFLGGRVIMKMKELFDDPP